jgi:hypothetical protein
MDTTDIRSETGETKEATPAPGPEIPITRDARGRFVAGAPSGNPRGRPVESHEMKALARDRTAEAIKRLTFWLRSDDPAASVAAAKELLNRGYGRPEQSIAVDATIGPGRTYPAFTDMDETEASRVYQEMLQVGKKGGPASITLLPPTKTPEQRAAERYGELMGVQVDEGRKVIAAPTLARPVCAVPAQPQPIAAMPATDSTRDVREKVFTAPNPSPVAVDPDDPSVVAVVNKEDEILRYQRPPYIVT